MNETSNNVKLLEVPAPPQSEEAAASRPEGAAAGQQNALLAWVRQAMPTMIVFVALGGVALWGHQSGWTLPKFSALAGNGSQEKDDWCAEHSVPESICVECNQDLLAKPPTFGWCRKHGVFDCPLEHPEVGQLKTRPRITEADLDRAQRALDFAERTENNPRCKLHPRRIQFASASALAKVGIEVAPVWQAPIEEFIVAHGEITYAPAKVASLSAPVSGRLWRLEKGMGEKVKKNDVLALVEAGEVGKAKGEFLQAFAQVDLKRNTLAMMEPARDSLPGTSVLQAEAAVREAQIRLINAQQALVNLGIPIQAAEIDKLSPEQIARRVQFLGLPDAIAKTLDPRTTTANLIPIKAPFDGVIGIQKVVVGEMAGPGKTLVVVTDPSQMLLTLNVRLEEAKALAPGQGIHFRPDGGAGELPGKVSWINTEVDAKSRTVQVLAYLDNAKGMLRANTFGAGRIVLREEKAAVVVPNEALHWESNCHIVFVQDKDFHQKGGFKVFHVRSVRPGARDGKQTEIIAGVLPGEVVVTQGSAILRAELLKTNLGEG